MGFTDTSPRDMVSPNNATQLFRSLVQHKKVQGSADLPAWAKEFQKLQAQVTPARVARVLGWYCASLADPYLPQAYSAKSFREKFHKIEEAMSAKTKPAPGQLDEAQQQSLARLLNKYRWPPEAVDALPAALADSQRNAVRFIAQIRAKRNSLPENNRDRRFLDRVLEVHVYSDWVVHEWLPFWGERIQGFASWNVNPGVLTFYPASETFRVSFWGRWSYDWCLVPGTFNHLYHELLQDSNTTA